jgi:hypothetical protein
MKLPKENDRFIYFQISIWNIFLNWMIINHVKLNYLLLVLEKFNLVYGQFNKNYYLCIFAGSKFGYYLYLKKY